MEMTALLAALQYACKKCPLAILEIFSDSNLIVQTINSGWKKKANLDLWLLMDELNEVLPVRFKWVKGHHENPHNNECDKMAVEESLIAQKKSLNDF